MKLLNTFLFVIGIPIYLFSQIYMDGSTAYHSKHVYRGEVKAEGKMLASQSLILDIPAKSIYLDLFGFHGFTGPEIYRELRSGFHYYRDVGKFSTEVTFQTIYEKIDSTYRLHNEIQIFTGLNTIFPINIQFNYDLDLNILYSSVDTYLEVDYKIPWYIGAKVGHQAFSNSGISPGISDVELALSTFLSIYRFSIEPYLVYHISINQNKTTGISFSLSVGYPIK